MSQIIPGGRPRASSDGDILDEGLCGALFVNLNDSTNSVSRKNPGKASNVNNSKATASNSHLNLSNDAFDSDSEISSQSQISTARSRRRHFSFKSMRKAVSRAFVKDAKASETAPKKPDKPLRLGDPTKIWTPDLRHIAEKYHGKTNGSDQSESGTMSTARPLITDPSLGMTVPKWKKTPGTVGICNHGNSCFMNAVLQCLSNTDSFTEYFVRDFFKNDLKTSKNGKKAVFRSTHGEVTEQLGYLLKCLWSGKYNSDVSKEFKAVVGRFNQQYKGDHQHDAQEFLLWLLDRIHEDVSVFSKKKIKPSKAPVLKSDEELASEAASVNGESFVLKLFQALHSSTLTCPTCDERSSTFDPYLCVSLPLPQKCPRVFNVIVVSLESHRYQEVKMAFTLNQFEGVRDLRERVAADSKIPVTQLLLVQLKDDGFGATFSDEQPLSDLPESESIYAIETYSDDASMHNSTQEFDSPSAQVLVMHVEVPGGSAPSNRFGSPAMLKVPRDISWKSLQRKILYKMEDAVYAEILDQKLSALFLMRIYDGSSRRNYLPCDVDMPLYTQSADGAYSTLDEDFGPAHIKIIAEWDSKTKAKIIVDDEEHIKIDPSVTEAQNNPPGQGKVSLEECFKLYTQEEKLIGDDAWLCPHCKQQQQGTIKTLGLWSLPDILVLHLKRFKQTGLRRSKLNTLVEFPVDNLDMSGHLTHRNRSSTPRRDDFTYDLLGVSNHYGNMMGGHYTAYCRSPVDGEWREFNDTKVRTLEGPIATREAYLLFYQRRSLSKHVNQRLFTGDHWVFSLPIAPSERIEEASSGETTPRSDEVAPQPRRSRSRSASPSSHRQVIKDASGTTTRRIPSRPLTPQLTRRPMISYTDAKDDDSRPTSPVSPAKNSPRKSRPVQRQASEPGSHFRRERSSGAGSGSSFKAKDSSRSSYRRSWDDDDSEDFITKKSNKSELSNGTGRSHSQTRSKTADRDKLTAVSVVRHDPPKSNDLSVSTSRVVSHQSYLHDSHLEPDETYPSASSYDHKRYASNRNGTAFDPASSLQVRLDSKDRLATNHPLKPHFDTSSLSVTENAKRKLAQLMKQSSLERTLASIDTIEEEHSPVGNGSRKFTNQRSYELAKHNALDLEYRDDLDITLKTANGRRNHMADDQDWDTPLHYNRYDSNVTDYRKRLTENSYLRDIKDDYIPYSSNFSDRRSQSEVRNKLKSDVQYQKFRYLAETHFGPAERPGIYSHEKNTTRFADDTAYMGSRYKSPALNGDFSRVNKYATIGRITDTADVGRYERDLIPRSNTDHNIHYNNQSLAPPPSPTPPHSLREERTFTHPSSFQSSTSDYLSNRLSGREIGSMQSYDPSSSRSSDQDSLASAWTRPLPGYMSGIRASRHNFRPPRGTWGVPKPKPAKSISSIPTPCLRESSV